MLLKIHNKDYYEYKNEVFPNNSHIHIRLCDTESSYNCTSIITGSKIPKRDCILIFFLNVLK